MAKPKLKIYLDTSVPSIYFDQRDMRLHKITRIFWPKLTKYDVFISEVVLEEINKTPDKTRQGEMENLVKNFGLLRRNREVNRLADVYIKNKLMPAKYEADAVHIALATHFQANILISWNMRHIVRYKTQTQVEAINKTQGYLKNLSIITPEQFL